VISFKLQPDGGDEFEVKAQTRDILNWEKTTKGASFGQLAEDMKLEHMYKIAYIAGKRLGLVEGGLADFEATHDLVFEMEEEPDPTQSAR
jgi:hypothetical protein